jgi:hypothetical protein
MTEKEEVRGCKIRRARRVCGEPEPIFLTKSPRFSGLVGPCIVSMNNELFLASLGRNETSAVRILSR